jgi:hypothetical protein
MNNSLKNIDSLNTIIDINEIPKNDTVENISETNIKDLDSNKFISENQAIKLPTKNIKTNKLKKSMQNIFKSPQFHFTVVLLVILDCLCVSVELILDILISNQNKKISEKANLVKLITLSSFKINTEFISSYLSSLQNTMNCTREVEANIDFNEILLTKINLTELFLNKTEEDSEFYILLHSIETVLKYIGK